MIVADGNTPIIGMDIKTASGSPEFCTPKRLVPDRYEQAKIEFDVMMFQILNGLDFCYACVDDIVVESKDHEEHLRLLF